MTGCIELSDVEKDRVRHCYEVLNVLPKTSMNVNLTVAQYLLQWLTLGINFILLVIIVLQPNTRMIFGEELFFAYVIMVFAIFSLIIISMKKITDINNLLSKQILNYSKIYGIYFEHCMQNLKNVAKRILADKKPLCEQDKFFMVTYFPWIEHLTEFRRHLDIVSRTLPETSKRGLHEALEVIEKAFGK